MYDNNNNSPNFNYVYSILDLSMLGRNTGFCKYFLMRQGIIKKLSELRFIISKRFCLSHPVN